MIGPEPEAPRLSFLGKLTHAIPFGLAIPGKPRHYLRMMKAIAENWGDLFYARRILKHGVCDGCSLGPAGMRDDAADGKHLCSLRTSQLKYHTMEAMGGEVMGDVTPLEGADRDELRALGRIREPHIRHRVSAGFEPIPWDEAYDLLVDRMKNLDPQRVAWFAGSHSTTNEGFHAMRKAAQVLNCPNVSILPSQAAGLADVFGLEAPTGSLKDVMGADLIVIWGADPSVTHPVLLKYLHLAREQGSRIALVAPERSPELVKAWIPTMLDSAVFGSRLLHDFYGVRKGGDIAFIHGVMKVLSERNGFDVDFLNSSATGQDELMRALRELSWPGVERGTGVTRSEVERFAAIYSAAKSAVFLYSTGLSGGRHGTAAVRSLATLAAVRGMVGKKRCAIFPLSDASEQGLHDLVSGPDAKTLPAVQLVGAAQNGRIDFLYSMSGDLLDAPVDRGLIARSLERIPLRVHQGPVLTPSMLIKPNDVVLLLPSMMPYETPGGVTMTSVERRIRFSPEIPGPRIAEAKPEWMIPILLAQRLDIANQAKLPWTDARHVREDIEKTVPRYKGIAALKDEGEWRQWGGERLYERGRFEAMPGGKCRLLPQELPPVEE